MAEYRQISVRVDEDFLKLIDAWRRPLQMRSWLLRHDKTDGPANEPNQRPNRDRDSYPGKVRSMSQHSG